MGVKKGNEIINRIKKDIRQFWGAVVVFVVYYLISHAAFDAFCPFLVVTGFPCAGCGLTRAGLYLLQGNIVKAASINPSIFIVILFLLYCGYFRYIRGTKIKGFSVALGVLVAVTLAIYIYRMYLYFPNRVPYVYHKKNFLTEVFPWYGQVMERFLTRIHLTG